MPLPGDSKSEPEFAGQWPSDSASSSLDPGRTNGKNAMMQAFRFILRPESFCIHRLPLGVAVDARRTSAPWTSATRTPDGFRRTVEGLTRERVRTGDSPEAPAPRRLREEFERAARGGPEGQGDSGSSEGPKPKDRSDHRPRRRPGRTRDPGRGR